MLRLFLSLIALQILAALPRQACAAPWEPVSLRNAIVDAELVVLAEVVEASPMFVRARSIEVLRGELGKEDFVVTGFNRACWPAKDRERHSIRAKERHLFFLKLRRLAALADLFSDPGCPSEPTMPKSWRSLTTYMLPDPSLGNYLVERGYVYSDSNFCSDCSETMAAPSSIVFPVLRALVKPAELSAVATAREVLHRELTIELVHRAQTEAGSRVALSWLLQGQLQFGSRATHDAVLLATHSGPPETRSAAVRALSSLGPLPEVFQVLEGVLKTQDMGGELHTRATIALMVLDPNGRRAANLILGAIAGVDASESVPREVLVPELGRWTSARETMVRALTQYRAAGAEPILLALLQRHDNQPGTVDALLTHFSEFPTAHARAELVRQYRTAPPSALSSFHRFFVDTGDEAALDVVFASLLGQSRSLRETYDMLRYYALHRPPGDPRLEASVRRLLNERRGDKELALLLPLALHVQNESLVRALLGLDLGQLSNADPKTAERVARAILLKRSARSEPAERMREWIQLLIDDRWSGDATPLLLRECVCSTPDALQSQLKVQLEIEQLGSLAAIAERVSSRRAQLPPPRGTEFTCSQASAPVRQSPSIKSGPEPRPIAPIRGGCGAGCSFPASERHSGLHLGWLLMLAFKRRSGFVPWHTSQPRRYRTSEDSRGGTSS